MGCRWSEVQILSPRPIFPSACHSDEQASASSGGCSRPDDGLTFKTDFSQAYAVSMCMAFDCIQFLSIAEKPFGLFAIRPMALQRPDAWVSEFSALKNNPSTLTTI